MHNQIKTRRPEWTIIKLLEWAATYFKTHEIDSPRATAEILLAHSLAVDRIDLYLRYDQPLNSEELNRFKTVIKRRVNREPVAYILGRKEFWSLDLEVSRKVLIPRPETECLVERALEQLAADTGSERKRIMELGTGSGAIILALASENDRHAYWGTDISSAAIGVAKRNAVHHDLAASVGFVVADWLAPFTARTAFFDMIVSNPPYIKTGDLEGLQPEIRGFEPIVALNGAEDGLRCLRHIIETAHFCMRPGATLLLEMGYDQKKPLRQIIVRCDRYDDVRFYKDYSGHDRIVAMKKCR